MLNSGVNWMGTVFTEKHKYAKVCVGCDATSS